MNRHAKRKPTMSQTRRAKNSVTVGLGIRFSLVAGISLLGVLYLMQTSTVSTKGFALQDLEKQVAKLEQENRKIEVSIAEFSSMKSIQERLDGLDLVPVEEIAYANDNGTTVARR